MSDKNLSSYERSYKMVYGSSTPTSSDESLNDRPDVCSEDHSRAIEKANSMVTAKFVPEKKKATPKEVLFTVVAIICYLGSIFFVDSILEFFHVPGSSFISCIVWPCILGSCVYYCLEHYYKK